MMQAIMITVIFYTYKEEPHGIGTILVETRHQIDTGKSTIPEAYEVALAHGAAPDSYIRYQFTESINSKSE